MAKLSPTELETIDFNAQGWTEILNRNMELLNDNLLFVSAMLDVTLTSLADNDILMWDTSVSKWVNEQWDNLPTSTTSTTISGTTTTSITYFTTTSTTSTTTSTTTTTSISYFTTTSTTSTTTSTTTTTSISYFTTTTTSTSTSTTTSTTSTTTTTAPDFSYSATDKNAGITLSNNNDTAEANNTAHKSGRTVASISSGKWYWEFKVDVRASVSFYPGCGTASAGLSNYCGADTGGWSYSADGYKRHGGGYTALGSGFAVNDVLGYAVDMGTGEIWFAVNNTWVEGDPGAGTGASYSNLSGNIYPIFSAYTATSKGTIRYDGADQDYAPPSGFSPLIGVGQTTTTTTTSTSTTTTT